MSLKLLIDLPLNQFDEKRLHQLHRSTASHDTTTSFVVRSSNVTLSVFPETSNVYARWAACFLSPTLTESVVNDFEPKSSASSDGSSSSDFFLSDQETTQKLSRRLLSMVHPFLSENFCVKGVILLHNSNHSPADVVLVDLSHAPTAAIDHLLEVTNGQTVLSGPEAVLKIILISDLAFQWDGDIQSKVAAARSAPRSHFDWPTCPVCLHRIDQLRLGLPKPKSHQMCSKFCPAPSSLVSSGLESGCAQQRLLKPWPSPSRCLTCSVIDRYWKTQVESAMNHDEEPFNHHNLICCYQCRLTETIWVCLTCGFVGCGRYSNKHSVEHFEETGHPYSLELATLRIWDYATGTFAHRADLLDCPSSPPVMHPWIRQRQQSAQMNNASAWHAGPSKSPKKASMIGDEYEALLQSALEEQAQHFEGEITSTRARLTQENMDESTITPEEAAEIAQLKQEIASFRNEVDRVGRELVDWQGKEAGHRAKSQKLLREQQVVTELLRNLKEEIAKERQNGTLQVEELELQIADLKANQKMRHQFSQDQELQQAQIWGMSSDTPNRNKKGKKARRSVRK